MNVVCVDADPRRSRVDPARRLRYVRPGKSGPLLLIGLPASIVTFEAAPLDRTEEDIGRDGASIGE